MAGSAVVACKTALVALLQARPGLTGVHVTYGAAGTDEARTELVFTADARGEHEPASLRAGRTYRDETAEFDVRVLVRNPGATAEVAETRALALGKEVEECVADNDTLGVAGVNWVVMARWDLRLGFADAGYQAQIDYTIRFNARLT